MRFQSQKGFTLIEVLLSATLLATLSMLAARAIQQGVKAKVKIQGQIDDVSKMRDALRLIERDINLAFHHRDFEQELQDLIKKKSTPTAATNPATANLPPVPGQTLPNSQDPPREAPRKDPVTNFMGDDEKMSFVTMNNARMVRNSRQADFMEVGYALKDCKSADGKRGSKCLWRRSSIIVDDDVTLGGDEVVLLEDVSEFKLHYIGKGKQDWVTVWHSDKSGDAVTKGNFPQGVKVSLSIQKGEGTTKKKFSMEIVSSVHFPNNKEDSSAGTSPTGLPAPTTPGAPAVQ